MITHLTNVANYTNFIQNIYGDDNISTHLNLKLIFDDPLIRNILSPDSAITLVKLSIAKNKSASGLLSDQFLQTEADVVAEITQ